MASESFRRPGLAQKLTKLILDNQIGSSASSGIFLAAPRRTGKSTFVREDLRPALNKANALTLYVDLWANKTADPGALIEGVVREELAKHEGVVARIAKSAGMDSVSVGGMAFSLDKVGLGKDVSLSSALAALSDEVKRPIVLLIDEAQHAITTEAGYAALFALKAARDELNSSLHFGLRIVATGSNRDKLAMLRNSKDQAFFNAPLIPFPVLDIEFVKWFCAGVNLDEPLDVDQVNELFKEASSRPETLAAAADTLRFNLEIEPGNTQAAFAAAVRQQIKDSEAQSLRVILSLTPLQSCVLRVMAARGVKFAPFEEATMQMYRQVLQDIAPNEKVVADVSNVQQALFALQEKSLAWKEGRGVYSLEELAIGDLMRRQGMLKLLEKEPDSAAAPSDQS